LGIGDWGLGIGVLKKMVEHFIKELGINKMLKRYKINYLLSKK
jgi:hypothetical protein